MQSTGPLKKNFAQFLGELQQRVINNYKNNRAIKYIQSKEEFFEDQGIKFNIRILESLQAKPVGTVETFSPLVSKQ